MDHSKIIDKIAKLMAKAGGTDNEAEVAAFASKAADMLAEYADQQGWGKSRRSKGHTYQGHGAAAGIAAAERISLRDQVGARKQGRLT